MCKLQNEILKDAKNVQKLQFFVEKRDFSAFLAFFTILFSSLHNPNYNRRYISNFSMSIIVRRKQLKNWYCKHLKLIFDNKFSQSIILQIWYSRFTETFNLHTKQLADRRRTIIAIYKNRNSYKMASIQPLNLSPYF